MRRPERRRSERSGGNRRPRPAHLSRPGADRDLGRPGSAPRPVWRQPAESAPARALHRAPADRVAARSRSIGVTNPRFTRSFANRLGVLISLRLPVSPVQLRADARRPHLRAGHRGRGRHPPTPADPARAGGLHGRRGVRGPRRGPPVPPEPPRHRDPRRRAPRPRRLAGPRADPGHERRPGPHAHGPRDRTGQGAGPQCRGRRLPDQAVQPGGAVGPAPGHQPPAGVAERPGHHLRRRHLARRLRPPGGHDRRRRRRLDPDRIPPAGDAWPATRARSSPRTSSSSWPGTTRAGSHPPGSSTPCCGSGGSSAGTTATTPRSRRCGGSATATAPRRGERTAPNPTPTPGASRAADARNSAAHRLLRIDARAAARLRPGGGRDGAHRGHSVPPRRPPGDLHRRRPLLRPGRRRVPHCPGSACPTGPG